MTQHDVAVVDDPSSRRGRTAAVVWACRITAVLHLAAAPAALGVLGVAFRGGPGCLTLGACALAAGGLISLAVIFWSLAAMIRRQRDQIELLEQLVQMQAAAVIPQAAPDASLEILAALESIRDVLLLNQEQREAVGERRRADLAERLIERFESAMERGDFRSAEAALAELARRVPDEPRLEPCRRVLREARESARRAELTTVTTRTRDLIATGRFADALEMAEALAAKYAGDTEALELVEHVRREREAHEAEKVQRLFHQVEVLAENRQWKQAVEAARAFLDVYPDSAEADLVRATLPTLQDNARLAEVRQLRDRIRDLIARQEYREALALAETVVAEYPETAAARELKEQMPRLRERAEGAR